MSGLLGKVGRAFTGSIEKAPRYMLTDEGEERLTKVEVARGREQDLLFSIKKLQPTATVRTLSKDLQWPINIVERGLKVLFSEGLIQKVE